MIGLESLPIPLVWYTIDTHLHASWHRYYAPVFDIILVAQQDWQSTCALARHRQILQWAPLFINSRQTKHLNLAREIPLAFVGTMNARLNPKRVQLIEHLVTRYPITVQSGPFLDTFNRAKIVLNQDAERRFVILGDQRHRGVEFSLAGHFNERIDLLVGGYVMDPSVTGPGRAAGLVGPRPTGVPKFYGRLDASFHTGLPGALSLTASVEHLGARPATATEFDHLGGKQLMLPSVTTLDLGTRNVVPVGKTTLGVRMLLRNLFDAKAWHASSPDVLFTRHRRSVLIVASLDF